MTIPACHRLQVAAAALALIAATAMVGRAAPAPDAGSSLLRELGFSTLEIDRIAKGEVLGRSLRADSSEVALAVAASIRTTPAFYLERLRDITTFKTSSEVLQIGKVAPPPSTRDFAVLTLENDDVKDLRSCRIDRCGVKLDRDGVERLARRDADIPRASAAMREFLAGYTSRYLQRGNPALIEYRDDAPTRPLLADLAEILKHSGYLQRGWPALYGAVAGFDGSLPTRLDGFLYWSKEKIGPRAVVSVTHVVIDAPAGGAAAVATKQVYASHYSDASLGVTMLFDQSSGGEPRTLVVYTNRSRLDVFGGIFGALKRPIVRGRARDGATRTMERLRQRMEHQFRG